MATEVEYLRKLIAKLRQELEDLIDYLELLEARLQNFEKPRYSTAQVKKLLEIR